MSALTGRRSSSTAILRLTQPLSTAAAAVAPCGPACPARPPSSAAPAAPATASSRNPRGGMQAGTSPIRCHASCGPSASLSS